jgi:ubiquinone/menaquinone biosynthesis C-methylase UbiE
VARQGPGRPQRWMAALDRIRLTGLLRKSPAPAGLFYWRDARPGSSVEPAGSLSAGWLSTRGDSLAPVAEEVRHPLFARFFDRLSRFMEAEVGQRRDQLLAGLDGRVLEIGAGNGINFGHYPDSVSEVVALEPEAYLRAKAEEAAKAAAIRVTVQPGVAERLDFPDVSFDGVVACLVLCSVSDPADAIAELARVLKPGGSLRFFEHVRAPGGTKARLQSWADGSGIWPRLGGGCHSARDTVAAIESAGFRVQELEQLTVGPGWAITNPHVLGRASRLG